MTWLIVAFLVASLALPRRSGDLIVGALLLSALYAEILQLSTALTFVLHATDFAIALTAYASIGSIVIFITQLRRSLRQERA